MAQPCECGHDIACHGETACGIIASRHIDGNYYKDACAHCYCLKFHPVGV